MTDTQTQVTPEHIAELRSDLVGEAPAMERIVAKATNERGQVIELLRYQTGNYHLRIDAETVGLESDRRKGFAQFVWACSLNGGL